MNFCLLHMPPITKEHIHMSCNQRIRILEVAVDDVVEAEAIARIAGFVAAGGPHQVVTVNPEFVMEARHNGAFRRVLAAADMATPDGFGLLLAARLRGGAFRGRVTGVALTELIAAKAAVQGWSLFLLGAAPSVAERAARVLQDKHPGLRIAGCYAGSPRLDEEASVRARIIAAQPTVLLVAYGHPAQDLWIARNQPLLRVPVAIGVGGVFDYLAGETPRAPRWMRRIGLEWLYRLIRQPQRWRRILVAVPLFLWAVLRESRTI
jgi:N-acetylglucosaminyldiphosphoundecaprenol N-acetyl-beta-D-mannosaminyltransferase